MFSDVSVLLFTRGTEVTWSRGNPRPPTGPDPVGGGGEGWSPVQIWSGMVRMGGEHVDGRLF